MANSRRDWDLVLVHDGHERAAWLIDWWWRRRVELRVIEEPALTRTWVLDADVWQPDALLVVTPGPEDWRYAFVTQARARWPVLPILAVVHEADLPWETVRAAGATWALLPPIGDIDLDSMARTLFAAVKALHAP